MPCPRAVPAVARALCVYGATIPWLPNFVKTRPQGLGDVVPPLLFTRHHEVFDEHAWQWKLVIETIDETGALQSLVVTDDFDDPEQHGRAHGNR